MSDDLEFVDGGTLEWGIVRDQKLTPIGDFFLYNDRSIQRDYGRHRLTRVTKSTREKTTVRCYWRSLRVPRALWKFA